MEIEQFDFAGITKNSIIKIISNIIEDSTKNILQNNICAKMGRRGIKAVNACVSCLNVDDIARGAHWEQAMNHLFIFNYAKTKKSYLELYLYLIKSDRFYCYLISYLAKDQNQVDASIIFFCNIESLEYIIEIYNKYIKKDVYPFGYVLTAFKENNVIVINNGLIASHKLEYVDTYIISYHNNHLNYNHISTLIEQIDKDKSVYHVPNGSLRRYLRSHLDVLKIYHFAIFVLGDYCLDIQRLILTKLLELHNNDENIDKIMRTWEIPPGCCRDYYFLQK
uniref:Uncharacterized protein n=1 Tax=viral metagenome TaxID=1070528 RepID=A0A6C0C8L7_9ZZZZ